MSTSKPWPEEWVPPVDPLPEMLADGREYHNVLFHDGDVTRPRGWHRENVAHLIELLRPHLGDGSIGLDYATGTGGSALPLLTACEESGINVTLALTDVMPSWFLTAHRMLHEHAGTHFFLLDLRSPMPLLGTFGENRFDFIVSASTIHLLPEKKLEGIFQELHGMLKPGGVLVFNSGDLEHPKRAESNAALLHDIYRVARDLLHEEPRYQSALLELKARDPEQHARVLKNHAVFPKPFSCCRLDEAVRKAGFVEELNETLVIDKARQDALDFIQVERLTGIAGAIAERNERRELIAEFMELAFAELVRRGEAEADHIRTFWNFGVYRKSS